MTIDDLSAAGVALNQLVGLCHGASSAAGWWSSGFAADKNDHLAHLRHRTSFGLALIGSKVALIHSEVSEALEGVRKDNQDAHLPQFKSVEVELADAIIRICDLAGAMRLRLGEALVAKMLYNMVREDHKPEVRTAPGGKAF